MKPNDCDPPFKPEGSPFFVLPGLTSPERVMIDSAHTWHIGIPSCNIKLCIYTWKVVQFSRFKATKDWKRFCFLWGGTTCKAEIIPRSSFLGSPAASCIQTVFGMVCSLWQKYEHRWLFQEGVQNGHDSWYIQVFYAKATLETHHHNMWQTPTLSMGWFLSSCVLWVWHVFDGPSCPWFLRNNAFPTATGGKGADTSLVSAWLEHVMDGMDFWFYLFSMCSFLLGISVNEGTETITSRCVGLIIHADSKDCDHDLFRLLHYSVKCSNGFYRLLHWRGLWLGVDDCRYASKACHEMVVSWLYKSWSGVLQKGWNFRPF